MKTVLLIEDSPGDARLIHEYLQQAAPARFELVHRERLAEGWAYLESAPVDLILLDLSLPDGSGLASVRRFTQREEYVPPIVVLTGLRDEALALQAVKEGAQDYLVKGDIDEKLLVRAMTYAVERYSLQRSLYARTAELEQVNRALNVRSECNRVLARAENEQALLDDVCQIMVSVGGYRLAWIGAAQAGNGKRVAPIARAGPGSDYLDKAQIRWDKSEWGQGPAGRAIRSGRPVVIQDLHADASFEPWQRRAEQYGYRSVLALPLALDDGRRGVLVVYGDRRSIFDEKEVALFAELVGDIVHGLGALSDRRRRRQAERQLSEREHYFRALIENAQDIITILDPDGTIRYQSPAVEQVLGYRPEELVGHSILEFVRPEEQTRISQVLDRVAADQDGTVRLEVDFRHRDGSWRRLEAVGKNLVEEAAVAGYIVNSRDVTERRRAEAALHQSRERLLILHEIEQAILGARSPVSTAGITLEHVRNLVPFEQATIHLFDRQQQETVVLATATSAGPPADEPDRLPLAGSEYLQQLERGQHIVHADLEAEDAVTALQQQYLQDGLCSYLAIPLTFRGRLLGEFALAAKAPAAFTHEHVQIAYEVAASLSVALQNTLLYEETDRRAQELEALARVSAAMRTAEQSQELLATVAEQLQELLGINHSAVALREQASGKITLKLVRGDHADLRGRVLPADEGITARVINSGRPFVTGDLMAEPLFLGWGKVAPGQAAVCVPLSLTGEVIGALWAVRATDFSRRELRLLTAIGDMVANALRRATLHEQTLAHARQIEQMIEAVPDGMLVLDSEGYLALANRAARELLPLLTEAGVGEQMLRLGGRPLPFFLQPPPENLPWHELEIGDPLRVIEIIARPIVSGSAAGATVMMIRDATEERRRRQYLQAQERLATVGQLAAGIAHDFNNIMAIITLYSQSLERNPDLPKRLQYLHTIGEQARHAANLITQILDFSRTSVMERYRVDLYPFVKEIVKLLGRTVPESIFIDFEAEKSAYPVHADPTRLQQMLMNLALNARDALPGGGRLHLSLVTVSISEQAQPPLPGMTPGKWIRLRVRDDGAGIRREDLPHIFEPFFTTKEPGEGTGLGLAQVYGIVKQHGGEIGVESEVGEGTCFTIYLPALLPRQEAGSDQPEADEPQLSGRGERILLVEDNEGTREAIADVLEMNNYRVWEAADGEEALQHFARHADEVDLVISDMVMPHVDGLLLYHRLQEIDPEVKVVIITGYPLEEEGKTLLEEGIVAWIQKPFTADQVNETVYAALRDDQEEAGTA